MKHVIVGGTFKSGYYFFNSYRQVTDRTKMEIYDTNEEAHDEASFINHWKHSVCIVPLDELDEYLATDYDGKMAEWLNALLSNCTSMR